MQAANNELERLEPYRQVDGFEQSRLLGRVPAVASLIACNAVLRTHSSSMLIFDIDHFKRVNDGYGHAAGDLAIQHCAKILKDNLRETDIAGRYGGEEYTVILIDTTATQARIFAERIRKAIEAVISSSTKTL